MGNNYGNQPNAQALRDEIDRLVTSLNINVDSLGRIGGPGTVVSYTIVNGGHGPWITVNFT